MSKYGYRKTECICGRRIGTNAIRQHQRRCAVQLRAWRDEGRSIRILDERTEKQKKKDPILPRGA